MIFNNLKQSDLLVVSDDKSKPKTKEGKTKNKILLLV